MRAQASYTITQVKDGNDLDSILVLWQKTKTNVAPDAPNGANLGNWSEEMPEFEAGAFVWTCNRVAINDPTASTPIYIYTDPVLDTSWKKLDDLHTQGTEIKNTVDNITLKYYNTNGEETSFKLTNGAIDITLLKNQIDEAAATATNFISMTGNGGIEVGNKSGGSWQGYRSQMLADSFNILDANGKKLASYGANAIDLGLNKENSVVRFCGEEAAISYDTINRWIGLEADDVALVTTGYSDTTAYLSVFQQGDYGSGISLRAEKGTILSSGWFYSGIDIENTMVAVNAEDYIFLQAPEIDVTGRIRGKTEGVSWYQGRRSATFIATGGTGTSAYFPVLDTKCDAGDWSIGTLGSSLYAVFTTDSDYDAGNNVTKKWCFAASDGSFTSPGDIVSGGHIYTPGMGAGWIQMKNYSGTYRMVLGLTNATSDVYLGLGSFNASEGKTYVMAGTDLYCQMHGAAYFYPARGVSPAPYAVIIGHSSGYHPHVSPAASGYGYVGLTNNRWNNIYTNNVNTVNAVTVSSDRRLKKDISYDFSSLDKVISSLNPAIYKLIADEEEKIRFGFIAQDVQKAFSDAGLNPDDYAFIAKTETDDGVMLGLGYTETNALLWHRQQQLEKRIEELEKRIA